MKKSTALIIFAIVVLSACSPLNTSKELDRSTYYIDIEYNPVSRSIIGKEMFRYININKTNEVYFHLYSNAYQDKKTANEYKSIPGSYPDGFNPGNIKINSVKVDGKQVDYYIHDMLLDIIVPKDKLQQNNIDVEISFESLMPEAKSRFGMYNGITYCAYWYPILCMYDENGWNKEDFYVIGESGYSDLADYDVKIVLPQGETVCSTGKLIEVKDISSDKKLLRYKETNIRDFAWFSSRSFNMESKVISGIKVNYYFAGRADISKSKEVLTIAEKVISHYNNTFGVYPYKQINIVLGEIGASEFPEVITISSANIQNESSIITSIAHELAHQWWYLTVGNNQRKEPWLDEALAVYSMNLYLNSIYGSQTTDIMMADKNKKEVEKISASSPVDKFEDIDTYGDVIYNKGSYILYSLNKKIGDEKFKLTMRKYYETYKFRNAFIDDFISIVEQTCGEETALWLKNKLNEKDLDDYRNINKNTDITNIIIEETDKLKEGEYKKLDTIIYGVKLIYKQIVYKDVNKLELYNKFVPLMSVDRLYDLPFNFSYVCPNIAFLKNNSTSIGVIDKFDLTRYEQLDYISWLFGDLNEKFISILAIAYDGNEDSSAYNMLGEVFSQGTFDRQLDTYFLNKNGGISAAYLTKKAGRDYGILVISNYATKNDIVTIRKLLS